MTEKVEGTIVLDGMLEGRLPDDPDTAAKLREWVTFAKSHGLPFTLDVSGNAFSLLPDNKPVPTTPMGDAPERTVRQALEQLLEAFPPEARANVFSTLRSSEFRKDEEVQSVYLVNPAGDVDVQSRSVDANTVAPLPPLSTSEKVKMGAIGLLMALAILGVAGFFVDYSALFGEVVDTVRPINAEEITVDMSAMEPYLREGKLAAGSGGVILEIHATDRYPEDDAAMQAAYVGTDQLRRKLAIESLMKGYVTVELFDVEGKLVANRIVRIGRLQPGKMTAVRVPTAHKHRFGRVVVTFG